MVSTLTSAPATNSSIIASCPSERVNATEAAVANSSGVSILVTPALPERSHGLTMSGKRRAAVFSRRLSRAHIFRNLGQLTSLADNALRMAYLFVEI